jgi:porphyrinogen peroxidase
VTGTLFFVPSATFLEDVAADAAPSATDPSPAEPEIDDAPKPRIPPSDGSLGIGSLKGEAGHE